MTGSSLSRRTRLAFTRTIYIAEIAQTDDEGRVATPEQQQANAGLIAAAPRLLKALEMSEQAIRGSHKHHAL
jgi:hypothetical protein